MSVNENHAAGARPARDTVDSRIGHSMVLCWETLERHGPPSSPLMLIGVTPRARRLRFSRFVVPASTFRSTATIESFSPWAIFSVLQAARR